MKNKKKPCETLSLARLFVKFLENLRMFWTFFRECAIINSYIRTENMVGRLVRLPGKHKEGTKRVSVTLTEEEFEILKFWADKKGISINDYLRDAIELAYRRENKDYDLAPLEVQRLNQLIDVITVLSSNIQSLESVTTSGFNSLLGLTRGDNYLLEDEGGEL